MDPTAAPVDLVLKTKTFTAHPLRDVDHEEFNKWIRREYLKRIRESTDDPSILRLAARDAATMVWMMFPGREVATTIEGMQKLASLMCRVKIPKEEVLDDVALGNVMDVFRFLHNPEPDDKDPEEDPAKEPEGNSGN